MNEITLFNKEKVFNNYGARNNSYSKELLQINR